jgi:hypothetical protein
MTIEDQVRFSYYVPNPAAYQPVNTHSQHIAETKRLGKISDSRHPSAHDYQAKVRSHVPAPDTYQQGTSPYALPEGGRLNVKPPRERMQGVDEYPKPAPGQYGIPANPADKVNNSGKFGTTPKVSAFIEDQVRLSRGVPAPGHYDVHESQEAVKPFCPEGGRTLGGGGREESYFDKATKLTQEIPGAGAYDIPDANQKRHGIGKVLYKYETATIDETRAMVSKAMDGGGDAPGPGAYDLPDVPPIAGVPVLKGRTLSHAMPHPFAYNCAPDHGRKYLDLAPVRSQNSGDLIFGTGTRRRGQKASRPASSGGDALGELPSAMGLLDEIKEDGHVEWKSGGFQALRKVRSLPQAKPEHPCVTEALKKYPKYAAINGRKQSEFLPNAARRSEVVQTHDNSAEYQRLQRGKWHLNNAIEGVQKGFHTVLMPLDEHKLKEDAKRALQDKAIERMRLEGVSKQQQEALLAEMSTAFEERLSMSTATPAHHQEAYDPTMVM